MSANDQTLDRGKGRVVPYKFSIGKDSVGINFE